MGPHRALLRTGQAAAALLALLAAADAGAQTRAARRLPARAPSTAEVAARLDSAWTAYERGDWALAAARAEAALAAIPDGAPPTRFSFALVAARAHADLGEPATARALLERALALDVPRDWRRAWALAYLGRARFALGDTAGARAALDSADASAPSRRGAATVASDRRLFGFERRYAGWTLVATPHLRLRFSPRVPALDRQAFADVRERAAVRIAAALGDTAAAGAPKPIDVFVWDSDAESGAAGLARVHIARPTVGLTHLTWDQTVGHELAHVIAYRAVRPETPAPLVTEGVAVYFDGSTDDRLAEAAAAVGGRGLARVDVRALWRDWGTLPTGVSYPVAGAVVETLVREGGRPALRALLRTQTLDGARRVYGPGLDGWLDAFEARLADRVRADAPRAAPPAP